MEVNVENWETNETILIIMSTEDIYNAVVIDNYNVVAMVEEHEAFNHVDRDVIEWYAVMDSIDEQQGWWKLW